MVNGVSSLNYGYDNYFLNNTYYRPVPLESENSIYDGNGTTVPDDSKAKDGKDDGSIGFFSALGHALKGGVKFVTGMFTDENGDFSIKQTLKTAGLAAAIGLATLIPVVGPFVIPTLCTLGALDGGLKVAKGFVNTMDAKTDAEAEQAFETMGEGATEGLLSYVGYKQTGGFKGAWDSVKPTAPTSGTPTSEPIAQLEAPKTTDVPVTEKPVTDIAVSEKTPVKYTENPNASSSSNSSTGSAKNTSSTGSTNSSSATGGASGSGAAETQTMNANDKFVSEILSKLTNGKNGGLNRLTSQEKTKLAEILDVPSSDLTHLSKAQIRKLTIKCHPDKGGSNEMMQIVNYLKDTYKEPSFRAAA